MKTKPAVDRKGRKKASPAGRKPGQPLKSDLASRQRTLNKRLKQISDAPAAETKAAPIETVQPAAETKPVREGSKTAILVTLMQRPGGATLAELMTAANWQAHSVRGFVAGTLKKMGLEAVSTKIDGVRRYEVKA